MGKTSRLCVLSDVHYAGPAEQRRGCSELTIIANPLLRLLVKAYRHFVWRRDPFAHNHLLEKAVVRMKGADYVVANGDYSCDTAFIGVMDPAAFESAALCLNLLREKFGPRFHSTMGDHELGKMSLFGGEGGMRLGSFMRAQEGLGLEPFWECRVGRYVLLGITSSLVALPVYLAETLREETASWGELRREQLDRIRTALEQVQEKEKVILFCHDPTALPFLWEEPVLRRKSSQIEKTIIGHLHSRVFLWNSRILSGMPSIHFLGNSIRRMSVALNQAKCWPHFKIELCPSLAGIELMKDGGFCELDLDLDAHKPVACRFHQLV